jgi:hypothetical protein
MGGWNVTNLCLNMCASHKAGLCSDTGNRSFKFRLIHARLLAVQIERFIVPLQASASQTLLSEMTSSCIPFFWSINFRMQKYLECERLCSISKELDILFRLFCVSVAVECVRRFDGLTQIHSQSRTPHPPFQKSFGDSC